MIANDRKLTATLEWIDRFQRQVAHLRRTGTNTESYHAAASGFLAEIDRMQSDVRRYLNLHPEGATTSVGVADLGDDLDALLEGVTEENRHPEWDTGPPVGREIW